MTPSPLCQTGKREKSSGPNHPGKPLHPQATREKSTPNHPGKPLHPPPFRAMPIWKQHISKRGFPKSYNKVIVCQNSIELHVWESLNYFLVRGWVRVEQLWLPNPLPIKWLLATGMGRCSVATFIISFLIVKSMNVPDYNLMDLSRW